jgi:hypothetical protein
LEEKKNQATEKILEDRAQELHETESTNDNKEKGDKFFSYFSCPNSKPGKDKLEMYLGGMDPIEHGKNKEYALSALTWWKVNSPKFKFYAPKFYADFCL